MNRVYAQINIRRFHLARLLQSAEVPECKIYPHDVEEYGSIEEIARAVRAEWLLPSGPISNVTQAIEAAGGVVVCFDFGTRLVDAISRWIHGLPPMFFINKDLPPDRWRFTLCYELGHLILHRTPNPDMEKQAHAFAAEFLTPRDEIKLLLTDVSLPRLAELKQYWKTSMSSLLKRAEELGRITNRQARYLWMQMGKAGYRTREPVELRGAEEKPITLQELIDVHISELHYSEPEISYLLAINESEFRSLYRHPGSSNNQKVRLSVVS